MTLPDESLRSIKKTRILLKELLDREITPRVPKEIRKRAYSCIRHYPWSTSDDMILKALETKSVMPRCLTCKFCDVSFGLEGYGPETPGEPGEWGCSKGKWSLGCGDDKKDVMKAMESGEKCEKWKFDERNSQCDNRL